MRYVFVSIAFILSHPTDAQDKSTYYSKSQQNNNTGSGTQRIYNIKTNLSLGKQQLRQNAINATSGNFYSRYKCDSTKIRIAIGGGVGEGSRTPVQPSGQRVPLYEVYCENGKTRVEFILRDSYGDEYANIINNTWSITNTNSIEYNNDSTGFEIRSGKRVIFQIEFLKDTIALNGMPCSDRGICMFCFAEFGMIFEGKLLEGKPRFNLEKNYNVEPLFLYPREKYLGVRASKHVRIL